MMVLHGSRMGRAALFPRYNHGVRAGPGLRDLRRTDLTSSAAGATVPVTVVICASRGFRNDRQRDSSCGSPDTGVLPDCIISTASSLLPDFVNRQGNAVPQARNAIPYAHTGNQTPIFSLMTFVCLEQDQGLITRQDCHAALAMTGTAD